MFTRQFFVNLDRITGSQTIKPSNLTEIGIILSERFRRFRRIFWLIFDNFTDTLILGAFCSQKVATNMIVAVMSIYHMFWW